MNENLLYDRLTPWEITAKLQESLRMLAQKAVAAERPTMEYAQRSQFTALTYTSNMRKRNRNTPLSLRSTAYARPLNMFAVSSKDRHPAVAHVSLANTANSTRSGIAGAVERFYTFNALASTTKSRTSRRGVVLGHLALSPDLQHEIYNNPYGVSPFDVILSVALASRDSKQPVEAEVWQHQNAVKAFLSRLGMCSDPSEEQTLFVLGEDEAPVVLEHWRSNSVAELQDGIYRKDGAAAAIQAARNQMLSQLPIA